MGNMDEEFGGGDGFGVTELSHRRNQQRGNRAASVAGGRGRARGGSARGNGRAASAGGGRMRGSRFASQVAPSQPLLEKSPPIKCYTCEKESPLHHMIYQKAIGECCGPAIRGHFRTLATVGPEAVAASKALLISNVNKWKAEHGHLFDPSITAKGRAQASSQLCNNRAQAFRPWPQLIRRCLTHSLSFSIHLFLS